MKKLYALTFFAFSLIVFISCNSEKKTGDQLDSLNESAADSLLQSALKADSAAVDSTTLSTDTLKIDSLKK